MGWLNKAAAKAAAEADDYDKAGDKAAKEGCGDSAEMFYDFAVDKRVEADRAEGRRGRGSRRS